MPPAESAQSTHRIGRVSVRRQGRFLVCESLVEIAGHNPSKLRFRVDHIYSGWASRCADPFLVASLIPAMLVGGEIIVDGCVTDLLLWRINYTIQDYLIQALPRLKRVLVVANGDQSAVNVWRNMVWAFRRPARILGFSGGVDSFYSLYNLHLSHSSKSAKITHLAFNDCGSHGHRSRQAVRLRKNRLKRVKAVGKDLDLPVIEIRSNMDKLYRGISFEETFTLRNIACSLLLQSRHAHFFYSSAHSYKRLHEGDSISWVEPFLFPLFSTRGLKLFIEGCATSRPAKIERLASVDLTRRYLDVCISTSQPQSSYPNCGVCRKCFHTLVILDACGSIDEYAFIFDLGAYYRVRDKLIPSLQKSESLLARMAYDHLRDTGFLAKINASKLGE
jgi:hypothetical protein